MMMYRFEYFLCKFFSLIFNHLQKRLGWNVGRIKKHFTFEYSIKQSHIMNASPIIITPAYLNEVSESFRQRIQAILPAGLTCTKFTDGRGQFGWSYYARIEGNGEILKMIRISNHDSGACGSSDYICGGWNTLDSLFDRVNHYFNGKPAVKQLVEMTGEYPTADAILKVFPSATNIVQGDFVRTAKKSGNAVYSFTFSVLK